ncbi:MAG: dipeptidase [Pseudomonadota bacterium]
MIKWGGVGILLLAILAGVYVFLYLPPRVDANMNAVTPHAPYPISADAQRLHDQLAVADLHADTLLWRRDPAKRHARGQTDLPRLRDGGVSLQVFSATTKSPKGQNYTENTAGRDQITLLAIAQRWPIPAWTSIYERAAYQARRLQRLEREEGGKFIFVRTASDLEKALATDALAGVFLIEGGHPFEGDIANVDRLYDEGLRIIGMQHFFDNALGGSLHGVTKGGLTEFGEAVVRRAAEKSMIIDVAHSSEAVVRDILAVSTRPVIVSHTGLNGHCESPRNISDETMKAIAEAGGLIGIGFWEDVVCGPAPSDIASAIVYAVDLLGADHVALGSDFDGTVTTPIDASEMAAITQALIDAGLGDETIKAVMGDNAIRFFLENLPAE